MRKVLALVVFLMSTVSYAQVPTEVKEEALKKGGSKTRGLYFNLRTHLKNQLQNKKIAGVGCQPEGDFRIRCEITDDIGEDWSEGLAAIWLIDYHAGPKTFDLKLESLEVLNH
jgi:hypothetical protein